MFDSFKNTQVNPYAALVVVPSSLLALIIGVGQISLGSAFGLIPLLVGIVGVIYLAGGIGLITDRSNHEHSQQTQPSQGTPTENALAVVRERYARGDIDQAEFDRRLDHLLETETLEQAAEYRTGEPVDERSR